MIRWLRRELLRPRTIFLVLVTAAFESYNLSQLGGSGKNGWDLIYPSVVADHFIVMIGLLWWNFVLIDNSRVMAPLEVIIRHGSRLRIFLVTLRRNSAQFALGCVVVAVISFLLGLPAGLSASWGRAAETAANSNAVITYYTTASGARLFPNPWEAVAVLAIFIGIAFLGLSAVHTAVAVSGHGSAAGIASVVLYVWSTACSFGVAATLPPAFDTVTLFDDEWAISQHALYIVIALWLVVAGLSLWVVAVKSAARALSAMTSRWWSVLLVPIAGFVFALPTTGRGLADRWGTFFLGQDDNIVGYIRVAALMYLLGTFTLGQYIDATDERFLYTQIRYGTRWRALAPHLLRAVISTAGGGVLFVLAVAASLSMTGASADAADYRMIALTAVGFLLSTWIVTTIGLLLATLLPGTQSWFWVVFGAVIAGYAPFIPLGSFNVFALFSVRFTAGPSFPLLSFIFAAALLAALVLTLLSVSVWFVKRAYTAGPAPIGSP